MPRLDALGLPRIQLRREIGQAGCFRYFEAVDSDGEACVQQSGAEATSHELAVRRLAREMAIAPNFRGRMVAPFHSWTEATGSTIWRDDGLRPAIQRANLVRDGLVGLVPQLIRIAEAVRDLHSVGLVHGALFPLGPWVDYEFETVRFADCSLAFGVDSQISAAAPWGLICEADRARLSPEQIGEVATSPDERTDCYGLGLLFASILNLDEDANFRVPAHWQRLVQSMRAWAPSTRPPSVAAIVEELRDFRASAAGRMKVPTAPREQFHRDVGPKLRIHSAGREEHIDELRNIWAEARGKAVAIVGPPGIGKTELSRLFADELASSGVVVAYCKGDPVQKTQPLFVVRQVIRSLWAQILLRGNEEVSRIRGKIKATLNDDVEFFIAAVPEASHLLGPAREPSRIAVSRQSEQFAATVCRILCAAAEACGGLCAIFDDVQWLDQGSLQAIERLLGDVAAAPILLLLISRTASDAPPPKVISGLRRLVLGPMPVEGIGAIIERTFEGRLARRDDFARQLHTLSGGSPLYVTQILHLMASRGGVYWDAASETWTWRAATADDYAVNDDALALIAERVAMLARGLRETIRAAAGLAEVFDARELCVVLERSGTEVEEALSTMAASGLILPAEGDGGSGQWRFIHDHVRLAALHDVPPSERTAARHQIGLRLLSGLDDDERQRREFTILDSLADCPADGLDLVGRSRLADLEISGAVDARRKLDFEQALRHLDCAARLLPPEPWRDSRDRIARIVQEQIYCAFAKGEMQRVAELFSHALENSKLPLEAAYFYRLQVVVETQAENYLGALHAAVKGLSELGVRMPLTRTAAIVATIREFALVSFNLGRDPIKRLAELRNSDDPVKREAIDLIASVLPAAYIVAPELMMAGGLKILRLSLRHGRARSTPIGEALYGLGVSAFLGARRAGFRFGELAVLNAEKSDNPVVENQVLLIYAAFVRFWAGRLVDDEPLLRRGYELSRKCGDMLFANFHILGLMSHGLARGAPLGELQQLIEWGEDLIRRSRDTYSLDTIEKWRDVVAALRGPRILGAETPESLLPREGEQAENPTSECYRRVMLCQFRWFAGDAVGALAAGREAERIIWRAPGHLIVQEHAFYYGLALAAAARRPGVAALSARLYLRRIMRRISGWAASGSDTFSTHLAVLRAERQSLTRNVGALRLYEEAVRAANTADMPHIAAIANEAIAKLFLASGSEAAALAYAVKARELYEKWGATAKVRALEAEIPALQRPQTEPKSDRAANQLAGAALHTLLLTTNPNDMVATLLTLAARSCGAALTAYASVAGGAVTIDAEAVGAHEPEQVGLSPELLDSASPVVLRYVAATGKELSGDLAAEQRFSGCRRLSMRRPGAVCCLPVERRREVFGLLYLEHATDPAAFSFSVLEILRTLTGNMASHLENEQTTRTLRERSAQLSDSARRIALLKAARLQFEKFVPDIVRREIQANPRAPNLEARPRDVTVLFLDIAGYTSMNERISPQDAHDLIERCFSRLLDCIYRWSGEICETTGDGLILFFSSDNPAQHAYDAARSALEMSEEVARANTETHGQEAHVVVNFGLNSGLGAVGVTRLEGAQRSRWVYTVNGQVVNIAARIVAEAHDGRILIGPETARRIRDRIDIRSVGRRQLKGLPMDVELFSIN